MNTFHGLKLLFRIGKFRNGCCYSNRISSTVKGKNEDGLSMYSVEQQNQIIETLLKCIKNNITRPHLNEKRLQSLRCLFEQNPNIQSLEPLLTVNGIGPKLLNRICESILLQSVPPEEAINDPPENDLKKLKLSQYLITPPGILQSSVDKIVSIHLGFNAISWLRLCTSGASSNTVDCWDVMDLTEFIDKKYDIHSTWDLVMQFRYKIPDGDIYVMENNNWSNVANIKKSMKYHIQEAMITTAICSIFNQIDCTGEPREEDINQLYFLRTFTPSRLFNKIVGCERVSAQDIALNMMEGVLDPRHRPVTFTDNTANQYLSLNGSLRDNMCRALLLAVSFAELVLHRNPEAIAIIGKPLMKKKKI